MLARPGDGVSLPLVGVWFADYWSVLLFCAAGQVFGELFACPGRVPVMVLVAV